MHNPSNADLEPFLRITSPDGIPHPGYPQVFTDEAANMADDYYKTFVYGEPYKDAVEFWESCKHVVVSQTFSKHHYTSE